MEKEADDKAGDTPLKENIEGLLSPTIIHTPVESQLFWKTEIFRDGSSAVRSTFEGF